MAVWALYMWALVSLALGRGSAGANELQVPPGPELLVQGQPPELPSYWRDLDQEVSSMVSPKCSAKYYSCHINGTAREEMRCQYRIAGLCELCHCDPTCLQYGDCCLDYVATAAAEGSDPRLTQEDPQHDCVILDLKMAAGVLMVRDCRSQYRDTEEERFCHQQVSSEEYFYLLDLPVTSAASNTSYVNYFCAYCNDDAYDLVSWNVTINCNIREVSSLPVATFMEGARYQPGMRQWIYNYTTQKQKVKLATCYLQVLEFQDFYTFVDRFDSRTCSSPKTSCEERERGTNRCIEQVRSCDPTWMDLDVMDKCQQYSLLMQHDNVVYKNPHCAVCNYVNFTGTNVGCMAHRRTIRKKLPRKLPPSFSSLMDFNRNPCDDDQFYDPINLKCIGIKCGSLFTRENKECVRKTSQPQLSNSSVLNNACPKFVVTDDQFIVLLDGSVYINSSNKIFRPGDYEALNDSQILICNEEFVYLSTITRSQKWVTLAVLLLSLVCLLAHMIIYMLLPNMRNLPGRNLFSLSCSLFLAHFLFLISTHATEYNNLCIFMGLSLHYFWLASFCWMNVMSLDVYITFRGSVRRGSHAGGKTFMLYSMYAWGIPLLVILSALCVQFTNILPEYKPKYAGQMCWINNRDSLVLFFLFPIGAIVLENVALFIVTSYGIYQQTKITKFAMKRSQSVKITSDKERSRGDKTNSGDASTLHKQNKKTERKERIRLLLYIKLGVIQGLAWTTGFLAAFTGVPACWYLFTILNGLQGFFIFLSFDMKKKVWESLLKKVRPSVPHQRPSKETRTTTLTASTSSGRKQSAKSQRSTTSLLGAGGSGCRKRGLGVPGEKRTPPVAEPTVAVKEETNDGELKAPNVLKQGFTKGVIRWEDQHMKSCPVMLVHREHQNQPSWRQPRISYHSNTIMPCYSDDTLHKVMDKSVQRSFEIQKIVDLLQQIKKNKGIADDRLETNSDLGIGDTTGRGRIQSSQKINHGYETDESVMTRSRSLVARRNDACRHITPSFKTEITTLQPTTEFINPDLTSHSSKMDCQRSTDKQSKLEHPPVGVWPDLDDHSSVEQLSQYYNQEQVAKILATRLKRILLGNDDTGNGPSPNNRTQRGRCLSLTAEQVSGTTTRLRSQPGHNPHLNNTVSPSQSKVVTAATGEGVPQLMEGYQGLEERREDHFNNIALESPV